MTSFNSQTCFTFCEQIIANCLHFLFINCQYCLHDDFLKFIFFVCGLSANQQVVCYFEHSLDCLSNLVHKISYTGSTSPLDTVSQNQLQNLTLKRLLEFLLNLEFVWFQTKQFSGCVYRFLCYAVFLE